MPDTPKNTFSFEIHVEMWKHYDNLRQKKNGTFLTANTILAAVISLGAVDSSAIYTFIPIVGVVISIAWFLLLARNGAYIAYHRVRAGGGDKNFWKAEASALRSGWLDGSLSVAFIVSWFVILL